MSKRVVAVWLAAIAGTYIVARRSHVGPIVLRVTKTHGVHAGDAVAAVALGALAAGMTMKGRR